MTRLTPALFLFLSLALFAAPAPAQPAGDAAHQSMTELKAQLAPGKQIFVSRRMALTPADEAGFWPLYDEHQQALAELLQRRRDNVQAYARAVGGGMDEDTANDLADEALSIEADEAKLLDRTYHRLRRVIAPEKALKYLQLESKLAALQRYELAASLP